MGREFHSLWRREKIQEVNERRRNRGWENRNTRMERVQWETLSGRSRHEWKREAGRGGGGRGGTLLLLALGI